FDLQKKLTDEINNQKDIIEAFNGKRIKDYELQKILIEKIDNSQNAAGAIINGNVTDPGLQKILIRKIDDPQHANILIINKKINDKKLISDLKIVRAELKINGEILQWKDVKDGSLKEKSIRDVTDPQEAARVLKYWKIDDSNLQEILVDKID